MRYTLCETPSGYLPVVSAILHNPEEFPEPEEFRPERFLRRTSDGQYELNKSVRNPSDIAFGFGRRICPGRFFVDQFMFATIVSVLAVYEISAPLDEDGRPVPPKVAICDGMISLVTFIMVGVMSLTRDEFIVDHFPSSARSSRVRHMLQTSLKWA